VVGGKKAFTFTQRDAGEGGTIRWKPGKGGFGSKKTPDKMEMISIKPFPNLRRRPKNMEGSCLEGGWPGEAETGGKCW